MRYAVPGYRHERGLHCGSAAMRSLLAFRGIRLSEAMCFGLGSAAGFLYVPDLPVPPGAAFHGRTLEMERDLCAALGIPYPERAEEDADAGWEAARAALLSGDPILISTDLAYLDYFGTNTHFSGHRVVLFGFDDEAGTALLSDSERDAPEELPLDSLKRSRASTIPPYPMGNRWCPIRLPGPLRPLSEAIPLALARNAREILAPAPGELEGVSGMRRLAEEIPLWPGTQPNWTFAARFGYQVIEKRGTGGGFFRRLYASYLEEAAALCPSLSGKGLPARMSGLADGWTAIAGTLKEISETRDGEAFQSVAEMLLRQADAEEAFWRDVSPMFP